MAKFKEEKVKKPFYKRWWFVLIVGLLVIMAFTNPDDTDEEASSNKDAESSDKIDVDSEMVFGELTINFDNVVVEDEKATLTYDWINQAGDGKKEFIALAAIDVKQGDTILEEVSGAFDADNKNKSDVFFPNAENGEDKVVLEYALVDNETPIEVTITPLNDFGEESQSISVNIK